MAMEHQQCFPNVGEILIHSVKVKRRSNFYHLPDVMLVWSAFYGVKRNWFLSADVSRARTSHSIKTSGEYDTNNDVKMGVTNLDDNSGGLSSDANRSQTLSIPFPDGATEKNVVSEMIAGFKLDKSVEKTTDFQMNIFSGENYMGTDSRPRKKRKVKNTAFHNHRSEAGGILHEQNGKGKDHFDAEVVFKGTTPPTTTAKSNIGSNMTSQNVLASDEGKEENMSDGKMDHELAEDAPTNRLEGVSVKALDHSARLMDAGGGMGEDNTNRSKRKKKKVQKTAREVQDTTDMEQTGKVESIKPCSETHESDKNEEEKGLSLEHVHEVIVQPNSKASHHVDPESALKEASFSRDADAVMEPEISSGTKKKKKKKKKRVRKSVNVNPEQLGIELTDDGASGLCPPSSDHIPEETGNEEGIINHEGKDIQMLLDSSTVDAMEKEQGVDTNEGDSVIPIQTDLTSEDVGSGKKITDRKAQSSAGNCLTDFPAVGTENSIMELNHVDKGNGNTDKKEEEKGLSLEHVHEVIMPPNSKASHHVDPDSALKEASFLQDADAVMEPEISSGTKKKKKKKRVKKSVNVNPEQSGIEQTDNGTSGLCPPSTDHIPAETVKEEGIINHEGEDVQMLESFTADAKKVQGVNRNEGDSVILTQTDLTSEDVGSGKKIMDHNAQSSAGNCHADFPAVETENPTVELNQVDKGNANTENKDRKASVKRRKRKPTASQIQEDLPVEDQKVGIEALATEETSLAFVNSEQEHRHVDSSQVLSNKTEEKLNETLGIGENTCGLTKTSEKEGEGINFKPYFVPGQYQDKVDSGNKGEKATKSNQEMETPRRVKNNVVHSVSNSAELQGSIKSFENKKAEIKSRRKSSSRSKGGSAQNSNRDEMISNSFRRSSGASEEGAKDYRLIEMRETTLEKPNKSLAASSHVNKNNSQSLNKSSSERSEIFSGKQGKKRLLSGINVTNMMPLKTPQKKSLFTKSGAIFPDNSGESSGDENGTMHSDDSTLSPSDSSSMSGHSIEESDLSQDLPRNGSSDEEGRSTRRRSMPKMDMSASKDNITMDMILRSSKRFKKAKLLASQNEDEQIESHPIEFVPESQPS